MSYFFSIACLAACLTANLFNHLSYRDVFCSQREDFVFWSILEKISLITALTFFVMLVFNGCSLEQIALVAAFGSLIIRFGQKL